MGTFSIKQGRDIRLKGAAKMEIADKPLPRYVAVQPLNFKGFKPRLSVKVDDHVKVGTPVLTDKNIPEICLASPASGRVKAINRGEKRVLLSVVIETDGRQEKEGYQTFTEREIDGMSKADATDHLLKGGLWPAIRQRPFSKIADPHKKPKSVFVHAMNSEPSALDIDFILQNKEREFQTGLNLLKKLTDGEVHLCFEQGAASKALTEAKGVQTHTFAGPHPAGNVSTHIHYVDPVNKGDLVWYVEAQDVLRIAALFLNGEFPTERVVAVTGEKAAGHQVYVKTVIGAPLASLLDGKIDEGTCCLSGSVLNGENVGPDGYIRFYDSQVTLIPEGGKREFLGWLALGFNKYTFSRTFASAFIPEKDASLDTDEHGSHRAIVLNNIYDSLVPLDIMVYFLLKAVISGNIDEAEQLGILECDAEDFALCTFACPSKTDVGGIIGEGLALIEKEG